MSLRSKTSVLGLVIALAGCSGQPYFPSGNADHGPRYEKKVFFALKAVKADDEQRLKVLAAFDVADPQLATLSDETDRIRSSWRKLDPRSKDYAAQAETLARHEGEISAERLRVRAEFNRQVATVLDRSQWNGWSNLFHVGSLNEDGDPDDFRYLGPSSTRRASTY